MQALWSPSMIEDEAVAEELLFAASSASRLEMLIELVTTHRFHAAALNTAALRVGGARARYAILLLMSAGAQPPPLSSEIMERGSAVRNAVLHYHPLSTATFSSGQGVPVGTPRPSWR